jgi:TRAP-type C4-dicarboxylate transport system substrate-binding protein
MRRLATSSTLGLGLLVPVTLALALAPRAASAAPSHTVRIATLAPKNSSWGKVYAAWQKAVEKKSEGKLELQMFFNGVQGNEDAMVSKIRTGQLDGAALTSVGLSMAYKSVLVLQLPGVMTSWKELDQVRAQLQPDLEAGIRGAGFDIAGWGDVGLIRQFSKGFEVRRPDDVQNRRPAVWRNEPMGPMVYSTIGKTVPVPVDAMEMLPALRAGNVNIINAPALAAEQLQWTPYLDHVMDQVSVCAVGGLMFKKGALDGMPPDLRKTWDDLQKRASETQLGKIRQLDEESFGRIVQKMKVIKLTQAERDEWEKLLRKVVERLARGTFEKSLVNKVLTIRGFKPVE